MILSVFLFSSSTMWGWKLKYIIYFTSVKPAVNQYQGAIGSKNGKHYNSINLFSFYCSLLIVTAKKGNMRSPQAVIKSSHVNSLLIEGMN